MEDFIEQLVSRNYPEFSSELLGLVIYGVIEKSLTILFHPLCFMETINFINTTKTADKSAVFTKVWNSVPGNPVVTHCNFSLGLAKRTVL